MSGIYIQQAPLVHHVAATPDMLAAQCAAFVQCVPYTTNMADRHQPPPPHVQAAAYSFAQFTTSYAWGLFSNKYGRKVRSTYRRGIMQQLQLVPGCS